MVALNGLQVPDSLDLFAVMTAGTGMVALKSAQLGRADTYRDASAECCNILVPPSAAGSCSWH